MIKDIEIRGELLRLLPERAVYWPTQKAILVADLHIGKVGHFRKNGIAVPGKTENNNLWRLANMLLDYKPETVYFLGDLFHSYHNAAWEKFVDFLNGFPKIDWVLVRGNHDILEASNFEDARIEVIDRLEIGPFFLTHDREETDLYNLHGHIHPGVTMKGLGRQRLSLPCFFFGETYGILPSFGDFTGLFKLKPREGDRVFVAVENTVLQVG